MGATVGPLTLLTAAGMAGIVTVRTLAWAATGTAAILKAAWGSVVQEGADHPSPEAPQADASPGGALIACRAE